MVSIRGLWHFVSRDSLYTNSIYYFVNTITVTGLGFLFWWIAAHKYSSDTVGQFVILLSYAQLITTIGNIGLSFGVIRYLPIQDHDKSALINFSITYILLSTILLSCLVVIIGPQIFTTLKMFQNDIRFVLLFIVFTSILGLYQLLSALFSALRIIFLLLISNLITLSFRLLFLILLPKLSNPSNMILAYSVPTIAVTFVTIFYILTKHIPSYYPKLKFTLPYWKSLVKYSSSSYLGNILHDLPSLMLPQFIAVRIDLASAAYFNVVWNLYGLLTTLGNSISMSLFVEGSYNSININQLTYKANKAIILITSVLIIIIIAFSNQILLIFGFDYARYGTPLLRLIALTSIPAALVYVKVAYLRIKMQVHSIILTYGIIFTVCFLLVQTSLLNSLKSIGWIWGVAQVTAIIYLYIILPLNKKKFIAIE